VGPEYCDQAYWQDGSKSGYRHYNGSWALHQHIGQMLALTLGPWPKGSRVLDVGGAFGYHMHWLEKYAPCEGYVVDGSIYAIAHCVPQLADRTYHRDLGADPLPFPNEHFYRVVCIETLEHITIREVAFALREIRRVLEPGGLLYASIALGEAYDPGFIDDTHQTMRLRAWWESMFKHVGFLPRPDVAERVRATVVPSAGGAYRGGYVAREMHWEIFCYQKKGACQWNGGATS